MTVAKLIEVLGRFDPSLPVVMAMQDEYECPVDELMIEARNYGPGREFLYIDDTAGV